MPHVEPVAAKIIDLITFERRSRNLRLEMRTNAPPRVTARIRACLFDTTEIETVRFIYHSYSLILKAAALNSPQHGIWSPHKNGGRPQGTRELRDRTRWESVDAG
jgi:hypothetical protein